MKNGLKAFLLTFITAAVVFTGAGLYFCTTSVHAQENEYTADGDKFAEEENGIFWDNSFDDAFKNEKTMWIPL